MVAARAQRGERLSPDRNTGLTGFIRHQEFPRLPWKNGESCRRAAPER